MGNSTEEDPSIQIPFNSKFISKFTSFNEKFKQHLRTLYPALNEEAVKRITKRYIIEKCKSDPDWMAYNLGKVRLEQIISANSENSRKADSSKKDPKQSTKKMPVKKTKADNKSSGTNSKQSVGKSTRIDKDITDEPPRKKIKPTPRINFLPRDLCFEDFVRFTNLESFVKADIVAKNKNNSDKFLNQLDKYLKKHYAVFIKSNKWPKVIQFHDDSIETLDDFMRVKKQHTECVLDKEKVIPSSPDMFPSSGESKAGKSDESNLKPEQNRIDTSDGTRKLQSLIDLQKSTPDNGYTQHKTCPDNDDAIIDHSEIPEGGEFIDLANISTSTQRPLAQSQDPLALTTASGNLSEMNVSSIISDASHDTTVILNPASQQSCEIRDMPRVERSLTVSKNVSRMIPNNKISKRIERKPSKKPFSKENIDALHFNIEDSNSQPERVVSHGAGIDTPSASGEGENSVLGEMANNDARLVALSQQRVENVNLANVKIEPIKHGSNDINSEVQGDLKVGFVPNEATIDLVGKDNSEVQGDLEVEFVPNEATIDLVGEDTTENLINVMMGPCMDLSCSTVGTPRMPFTVLHAPLTTLVAGKNRLPSKQTTTVTDTKPIDANSSNVEKKSALVPPPHSAKNFNSISDTILNKMTAPCGSQLSGNSTPAAVKLLRNMDPMVPNMTDNCDRDPPNQENAPNRSHINIVSPKAVDVDCKEEPIVTNEAIETTPDTLVTKKALAVTDSATINFDMNNKIKPAQLLYINNIEQVSGHKNINTNPSPLQISSIPSKEIKNKSEGSTRNKNNSATRKDRKRQSAQLANSKSKKARKTDYEDETNVPQPKHTFQPLALILTSKTNETSPAGSAAKESPPRTRSSRNEQHVSGIDLDYFIEDVSQCNMNPSPPQTNGSTMSQMLSEDETFLRNIHCTPMEKHNETMECSNEESTSHCEGNTEPIIQMTLFRIVTELTFNWLTQLDVESIPNTIISHVVYKSVIAMFCSVGKNLLHATCRISNTKHFLFEIVDIHTQFTFNANGNDEDRLVRLLHTLQHPSGRPPCDRTDVIAANGLRYIFDYFDNFSNISIQEEDNQNAEFETCSDDDDARTEIFEIPEGAVMIDPLNISVRNQRQNLSSQEPWAITTKHFMPSAASHGETVTSSSEINYSEAQNMTANLIGLQDEACVKEEDSKSIKSEPPDNQLTTDDIAVLQALTHMLQENENGELKSSDDDYKQKFNLEVDQVKSLRATINESTDSHEAIVDMSEKTQNNIATSSTLSQQSVEHEVLEDVKIKSENVCSTQPDEDVKSNHASLEMEDNDSSISFVPKKSEPVIVLEDDDPSNFPFTELHVGTTEFVAEENQPAEDIVDNLALIQTTPTSENIPVNYANTSIFENNSAFVSIPTNTENLKSNTFLNNTMATCESPTTLALRSNENMNQTPAKEIHNRDSSDHDNVPIHDLFIGKPPTESVAPSSVACIEKQIDINESIAMALSSTRIENIAAIDSFYTVTDKQMKSIAANVVVESVNININIGPRPTSDHENQNPSPSEFQMPIAPSKGGKYKLKGPNRNAKDRETKEGIKRKSKTLANSKSKKPRKTDEAVVPQEKHTFQPLALVSKSKTGQTSLTAPATKEKNEKLKMQAFHNIKKQSSGIDLDYFIEDVSQCGMNTSAPQNQHTNMSQLSSDDETFLRNINCTIMKKHNSTKECSNDISDSHCEECVGQRTHMFVVRIITQFPYNWLTQLDVESIPNTIISHLVYKSPSALLSSVGKRQSHATCRLSDSTNFLFKIDSDQLYFSFNANGADERRLDRLLYTLENPSKTSSCARVDIVAVHGLRMMLDYFEDFSAISIREEANKNAEKSTFSTCRDPKRNVRTNYYHTISPQSIDYETFRHATNIESIFRKRIHQKYAAQRQANYLRILETIIQRYYEDHFRLLEKWPSGIKFRDLRVRLRRIKFDKQQPKLDHRKAKKRKWYQVFDMKQCELGILRELMAKKRR